MKEWIVYCEQKNRKLTNLNGRFSLCFGDAITQIENGDFLVIESPNSDYRGQKSFYLEINEYPIIVPFNIRGKVIQLVTMFPDRRYKNAKF